MENPRVLLPSGETVPQLGLGTWQMAEQRDKRNDEIRAIRLAVELGMSLIDTAEMYGEGRTETLVGEALAGLREQVFLVSKVYPQNAGRTRMAQACERSLKRLNTDRLDLYLLHWRGDVPLAETIAGFEALQRAGKIRHWGMSNFDTEDMQELFALTGGKACATNQILYNVKRRASEWDLLPWMESHRMPVMAYSPVEQGRLPSSGALQDIATRYNLNRYQIALAWLLRRKDAIVIPKTSNEEHLRQNLAALEVKLTAADVKAIDNSFKPPKGKTPLELL